MQERFFQAMYHQTYLLRLKQANEDSLTRFYLPKMHCVRIRPLLQNTLLYLYKIIRCDEDASTRKHRLEGIDQVS